jgi:hypothetical protein
LTGVQAEVIDAAPRETVEEIVVIPLRQIAER